MARRRFTEREILKTVIRQIGNSGTETFRCYRCKGLLWICDEIEREHVVEIALGGKDDWSNCAYSHKACHAVVTNGTKATTAGSSKQRIAKVKRLRGETCNGPKKQIAPRPFQKKSRPMSRTRYDNTKYLDRT